MLFNDECLSHQTQNDLENETKRGFLSFFCCCDILMDVLRGEEKNIVWLKMCTDENGYLQYFNRLGPIYKALLTVFYSLAPCLPIYSWKMSAVSFSLSFFSLRLILHISMRDKTTSNV